MGERETTLEREGTDVGVAVDGFGDADAAESRASTSRTDRLRARAGNVFSLRWFAITLVVALVGFLVAGGLPLLGGVASLLGLAAGTFAVGVATSQSRYLESAVAGASVVGVASLLDHIALTLGGLGLPVVAVGVGSGLVAGLVGHYFGRDLRAGLTRDV